LTRRSRRGILLVAAATIAVVAAIGLAAFQLTAPPPGKLAMQVAVPPRPDPMAERLAWPPPQRTIYMNDEYRAVADYFADLDYTLPKVRASRTSVPRVFLADVPSDLGAVRDVKRRKSLFIRIVLPLVLAENERLYRKHLALQTVREHMRQGEALMPQTERWLAEEYDLYGVDVGDLDALIKRVDAVPPSLGVAQAAIESAWGTSRFARQGNALFGQWTWKDEQAGIVPRERDAGTAHRIRAFESLRDSVRAYIHTLNSHWAYAGFRDMRARMRGEGRQGFLDGVALAAELSKYSQKEQVYVEDLRRLIRVNQLHQLDRAALAGSELYSISGAREVASARLNN
jgi:Bax protein